MDVDWKHSGLSAINDTCEPWLQETLILSLRSTEHFASTFLPETFNEKMTYQHKAAWAALDDRRLPRIGLCCYRGFGKSSMLETAALKRIIFRQAHHIMFVGASHDTAAQSTENIKTELLGNSLIKDVFGNFKPKSSSDNPLSFSKKAFYLVDPITGDSIACVHPKGVGQPVRGTRIKIAGKTRRVEFGAIDDLETDDGVLNEETRQKTRHWFQNAMFHCVDRTRPNPRTGMWDIVPGMQSDHVPWCWTYADTLKHPDAHIAHLMGNTRWTFKSFPQAEFRESIEDGEKVKRLFSLVPEIISHEQVREEYKEAKENGNLNGYCQEKLCSPMSAEMASWQREYFKYYDEATFNPVSKSMYSLNKAQDWERFMIVDPSRGDTPQAVPTGIIMCAANYEQGRVHFRKTVSEKLSTKRLIDRIFDLATDYNTKIIGIEITGLEDAGKHLFMSAAQQRNANVEFVWLDGRQLPKGDFGKGSDAAKRARASQILPYYESGIVWHESEMARGALESCCLSYPLCAEWGLLDCAGYVPTMLAHGGRIFQFKAPTNPHEKIADPFNELEDDESWTEFLHGGSWRAI